MPLNHNYVDTAKDLIGRTIARIRRESQYLDFLVNTYPDAASDSSREFLKKIKHIVERKTDGS